MPIEIIHHEESPGKRWLRLRQEFRQANLERIRAQFISVSRKPPGTRTVFTTNVLPEIHRMDECIAPPVLADGSVIDVKHEFKLAGNPNDKELDQLNRTALMAVNHIYAEIPDNVGLEVEDVDGPAINDLEDESQIFAAIDKMIQRGEDADDKASEKPR